MTGGEIWAILGKPLLELGSWAFKTFRRPDPVQVLEKRERLRREFEEHLPSEDNYRVRGEAIIRDIKRMDSYPKLDEEGKGISPWFKVEVKGLYHRGLEVFIGMPRRIKNDMYGEWQFVHYRDEDTILVYTVGRITFDLIEYVNWKGDDYYYCPHIYCRFKGGQPYEEIPFFTKYEGSEYLMEIKDFRPWDKRKWFSRFRK